MSYDDRFNRVVEDLLEQEGGFVNHENDRGGATNFGITIGFYRDNVDESATVDDIRNLTREDAKEIYYKFFWNPVNYSVAESNYSKLPKGVGEMIFQYAVNTGYKRAHRLLQQGLKELGKDVSLDGWLGPNTIEAANEVDRIKLLKWTSIKATKFYTDIVLNSSDQKVFLEGWLNRAFTTFLDSIRYIVNGSLE